MSQAIFVDPDLEAALALLPSFELSLDTLVDMRAGMAAIWKSDAIAVSSQTAFSSLSVTSYFGAPPIRVLSYRPSGVDSPLPALLHIHAGGFVVGTPEMRHAANQRLAALLKCAIYSVDYRLAPETPYPGSLEDCYSVLLWMSANAKDLRIDPLQIGVKGESAGGGLAASLALFSRDKHGPPLLFQHLIYPMIDDRTCVRTDINPHVGQLLWTREQNSFGWSALLGRAPGSDDVSFYAAAARADKLSGLPPTFISIGGLDLFLEENLAFANRLSRDGVPVELHVYPGAFHGFDAIESARISQAAERGSLEALQRSFHG